mmetsp:Transcript_11853/g.39402  ORF Transcript_11853/g.39402 Transcript_11853/m.39402 type:complete len:268 (+) Transcript_11853:147-950(+)
MLYKIWQHTTDDDDRGGPLRAGIRTETRYTQNIRSEQPRIPCLDLEGIPITPRLDLEKNQRQRHHRHPGEHAVRDVLIVRVVLQRGGEEFLQRNVHHHPPHHPEQRAVRLVRHAVPVKHQVPKHPADGLANSTHKAPPKPFPLASRRVVHRHRDAHAFGDVVHRDGHGERDAELHVRQRGDERRQTFGEVVQPDGDRGHEAHVFQVLLVFGVELRRHAVLHGSQQPDLRGVHGFDTRFRHVGVFFEDSKIGRPLQRRTADRSGARRA